jgi:hypothetical protein
LSSAVALYHFSSPPRCSPLSSLLPLAFAVSSLFLSRFIPASSSSLSTAHSNRLQKMASAAPDDSYTLYSQRAGWEDLQPIPQADAPNALVPIAYTEQCKLLSHFRSTVLHLPLFPPLLLELSALSSSSPSPPLSSPNVADLFFSCHRPRCYGHFPRPRSQGREVPSRHRGDRAAHSHEPGSLLHLVGPDRPQLALISLTDRSSFLFAPSFPSPLLNGSLS